MLTPRHSTLLQILDSPWFHLSIINLSVCLYGLWCDNCPIVLVRWHQRGLCPSDTDRYKEMFWQGKGIGRKPNNRMVSRVGLLCTLYSALMCRDVGWGQWSDLALAPGAWSAGHWGQGRESILWGEDITLQLVFCKQWTFIHVKRQENNWQTWRIVLYCFSLFVC